MAVGDAKPSAIDEAGEAAGVGHEIWKAGIPVSDDEVLMLRFRGGKPREFFGCRAFRAEAALVLEAGGKTPAGEREAVLETWSNGQPEGSRA
jgi:hypothetical protein